MMRLNVSDEDMCDEHILDYIDDEMIFKFVKISLRERKENQLRKIKNSISEDLSQLTDLTNITEMLTESLTRRLAINEHMGKRRRAGYRLRGVYIKQFSYEIGLELKMMFFSYLNPDEEITLLHLFKRIKSTIEKQRVWDLTTEEEEETICTIYDDHISRLTDELIGEVTVEEKFQKQMVPAVEIRQPKRLYFSDLPEEVLTILFCKGPLFRFELCSVIIEYGIFSKQPMLYGFIRAAESRVGEDGFLEVFNRKDNDPLVIPNLGMALLRDSFFSLPVSNPVQIHVKLHIKFDKVETYDYDDDDDLYTDDDDDYDDDCAYHNEMLTTNNDDDDDALKKDMNVAAEKMKAVLGKVTAEELEVANKDPFLLPNLLSDCIDDAQRCRLNEIYKKQLSGTQVPRVEVKAEEVKNEDEPLEVCNEYISISDYLPKRHNGGFGFYKTNGKDGSLELYYAALKNTVDADLKVQFFSKNREEKKVVGQVMTYYGKGFDYGCEVEKHLYSLTLFESKSDNAFVIKPGVLNLIRSVLPVPAQFSLIISVYFRDLNSEDVMLDDSCEFLVPCDGSRSVGIIGGNDCSLNFEVDWKLPFDHMRSI